MLHLFSEFFVLENRCEMMSEGIQESLCLIFKESETGFNPFYESALTFGISALQGQLVDDDKRSEGSQGHQRARSFVVDHNLLNNTITLTQKLLAGFGSFLQIIIFLQSSSF